jgi:hypothetical protein
MAAAPSPPGTYTPDAQTAATPPPSNTPTTWTPPAVVGTGYSSAAAAIITPSPSDGSAPSGLLVDLFGSKPAPSAAPANIPHPPSTYTASAPPYTPPPGAAPAPPPLSSPQ